MTTPVTPAKSQSDQSYYSDPDAALHLVERLDKAGVMLEMLESELMTINETAMSLAIPWHTNLELMLAHTSVDLRYLRAEIKRILGS